VATTVVIIIQKVKIECKRVKRRKIEEPPLPMPFILPFNYPKPIKEGLKSGSLTGFLRKKFLSTVANYVFSYKEYPTQREYVCIAEQIVKQYPFLLNNGSYVRMTKLTCKIFPCHNYYCRCSS